MDFMDFSEYLPYLCDYFGILGRVWYLIVSIPDLCTLTYYLKFDMRFYYFTILNISFNCIEARLRQAISVNS